MDKKTILIIDDDKLVLSSISNVFIKKGWTVNSCSDGVSGLEHIEKNRYDCVLLDIRMPDLDGTQVLERLRRLEKEKLLDHHDLAPIN